MSPSPDVQSQHVLSPFSSFMKEVIRSYRLGPISTFSVCTMIIHIAKSQLEAYWIG